MKSNRLPNNANSTRFRRNAISFGVAMAIATSAYSNPSGMSVVAGQATAQTIGNLMQITNTPGAILNWQQFNIDVGQTTQFIQQNASSQVFNRVTGGDVSQILGTLQSNGQVFLINPAGVFFGQGAVIDTAGFLASSLAASNTDLLNGHLNFTDSSGTAGAIVNQGKLTTHSGGSIVLLAPSIENSGIIHADGEVLLAAGHSVTIVDMKHPTIGLTVAAKEGDKAINLGQIISKNVSLFSHLVKSSGVVEATGAQVGEGGVIRFIAKGDALVSGKVLAESGTGKGGEIDITGARVAVLDGARISADGATGGGTVHVGGGWQGQDSTLANSQQTIVQSNTLISANATGNGNGGEVAVWADGHTTVNSEVQAKGGALGGDGGRVETSGKQSLSVSAAANTSAQNGEAGLWLIDPANLTIVAQAGDAPSGSFNLENASQSPFFSTDDISPTFSPTESYLLASTVKAGLENNGFVKIYTTGTQPGEGNLTINAPVLIDQNNSDRIGLNPELFLEAKGTININAAVGLTPGQTVFEGFDLQLSYDIAKPVYIRAPLYLGDTGNLILSPYDVGSLLPTNVAGQLPLDGVNFLSGVNVSGSSQPLFLNQITVTSAVATDPASDPMNPELLLVNGGKVVKLNVQGSDLRVNTLNFFSSETTPATDIRVEQGTLSYNFLTANRLNVGIGSTVSTYTRPPIGESGDLFPHTDLFQLTSQGNVNLNGGLTEITQLNVAQGTINFFSAPVGTVSFGSGFHIVDNINAGAASIINVSGTDLYYNKAALNGTLNLFADSLGVGAYLSATDTDLSGTLNLGAGFNYANFQALGMGSTSILSIGSGSRVELGRASSLNGSTPQILPPKQEGAFISSTQGQFVVEQGARIVLNGATSPVFQPPLQVASVSLSESFSSGAVLDVTGLDGRLDAPVIIQSNGFFNSIQTDSQNFFSNGEVSSMTPIESLVIGSANIQVSTPTDGMGLRIGGTSLSESPSASSFTSVNLDFNGSLQVNSGRVRLEGATVSTTDANVTVNGANSLLVYSGAFTSADLFGVSRLNGGKLAAEGFWDNSAVTSANVSTASPLLNGSIFVGDDLTISGGLLSSAGTANALNITPDGFLELRSTEVTTTINMAPTSVLLLAAPDETVAELTPVVLNNAKINMGGDAFLIVESNVDGVADLGGTATISSGSQGNLILAGRRSYDSMEVLSIPEAMTLNVGSGIRLNVTGNARSLPPGLALYYSHLNITNIPDRPVFTVGQLTPEAVAIVEYEAFFNPPITTVLQGFADPSFVIDGFADSGSINSMNCTAIDFCVKFDVAQGLNFSGSVMTSLTATTLAESGVAFVSGANLQGLQFAVQTPEVIQFMQGLNIITADDLSSGKTLVNGASSTVRLGANMGNETITSDFQNDGLLELQGSYTLSGVLSGTGTLNNTGSLTLSNASGSLISNTLINSGTVSNTGTYTLANVVGGTGMFFNSGSLSVIGTGLFGNSITNTGAGTLAFVGGPSQDIYFGGSFQSASNVLFGGGLFTFDTGYFQVAGSLSTSPGTTLMGNVNISGGVFKGFADIVGNLNASGARLIPGASPGVMTVSGDLTLSPTSVIDIEIQSDGGMPGIDYDFISVLGTANLDGQLNLIDISGGSLLAGNSYNFLQASTINGGFASVAYSPASFTYTFTAPALNDLGQFQELVTSTVATGTSPITTGSTGSTTTSVISQNLDQAFAPTSTSNTTTTTTAPDTTTTQQEEEAVEVASQSTGGTTVSQQSSNIELQSTSSDPQRTSAVCK